MVSSWVKNPFNYRRNNLVFLAGPKNMFAYWILLPFFGFLPPLAATVHAGCMI